jgi:putative oxidoreductase
MTFADSLARIAHWPLRLALGSVFLFHGLSKFPNLEGLAEMMGMPVIAVATLASMETLGAVLILLGGVGKDWMTRLGGLLIVPIMLGAILMVHLQYGWNSVNMGTGNMGRGMEFQFTLLMIAFYFVLRGNHPPVRTVQSAATSMNASFRTPMTG